MLINSKVVLVQFCIAAGQPRQTKTSNTLDPNLDYCLLSIVCCPCYMVTLSQAVSPTGPWCMPKADHVECWTVQMPEAKKRTVLKNHPNKQKRNA